MTARTRVLPPIRVTEDERAASERMRRANSPTAGRALNSLAQWGGEHTDDELAAQARRLYTQADRADLQEGG